MAVACIYIIIDTVFCVVDRSSSLHPQFLICCLPYLGVDAAAIQHNLVFFQTFSSTLCSDLAVLATELIPDLLRRAKANPLLVRESHC